MSLKPSDLKKYNFFSSLSSDSIESLAQKMNVLTFSPGSVVFSENDEADAFYFVQQGRLEVSKSTKFGQTAKLSILGSGQGFGEMAIFTGSTRCCTVRALTAAVLYRLMLPDFEAIMQKEPAFKKILLKRAAESAHYNKIKTLQPFIQLEPDKMFALMARMTERTYGLGDDIIVQGEKGDFYYIIKSGQVAVLQKKKGESLFKQVALLEEGAGFGEEALIRDDPRNATCRATEETTVYALDKIDFNAILKSSYLDNIFTEEITLDGYRDRYTLIDARVTPEYEQEHIEGAVSIPVEVLRKKYTELDPGKTYITYCTNDARGMVAAFLLKNHGFNAKCLRGGISSWTGPIVNGPATNA